MMLVRKLAKHMIGKIGSVVFKGMSIVNISLPVYIFAK